MTDRLRQALEDTAEIQAGLREAEKELDKLRRRVAELQVLAAMGKAAALTTARSAGAIAAPVPAAPRAVPPFADENC